LRKFLENNGLSLAFWALFLVSLIGQGYAGYLLQYAHSAAQPPAVGFFRYLVTPAFLQAVFSNWQAALLQFFALIVFAIFLRQRGASHSRKPANEQPAKEKEASSAVRRYPWLYRNSLSLAFLLLFAVSFVIHLFAGAAAYNDERVSLSEPPLSLARFFFSAKFWFATLQTWQAEFFVVAMFLVLSVYLRQEKSAESKPVGATDEETGTHNE
jgi:Ca2+/Na+ antiporter